MVEKNETPKYSNQISVGKFIFLSIISFGIYELVWFYRSWKFFKEKEKLNISPFWRAWFAIFFMNSLFKKMLEYAKKEGYQKNYSSGWRTFFWFIIGIMGVVGNLLSGWISIFTFLPLLAPLNAMNYYLNKIEKDYQPRKLKWWHLVFITIGIACWILLFFVLIYSFF